MTSKLKIIEDRTPFTVAETFVGCGGSHFGFKKSGFTSVFVNDIWDDAIQTLKINDKDLNDSQIICDDIHSIDADYLEKKGIHTENLDVLIGGVVCKGFSLAGVRNPYDPRNYLYKEQLRLVGFLRPKISIIENVQGMLNMQILKQENDKDVEDLCNELNELCEKHKKVRGRLIAETKRMTPEMIPLERTALEAVIVETKNELTELKNKRQSLETQLEGHKYSVVDDIEKTYVELGYTVHKKVLMCSDYGCHTNRQRLFIVAVRKDLNIDWEYPEPTTSNSRPTVADAFQLLDKEGVNNPEIDVDNRAMNHKEKTIEKFKKIATGGKSTEGYFSRGTSSRLAFDKPAPTLVPGHSAFQIHPIENRSITVREGAILTGFDKEFKFYGSHTSRCMQIGNAIPVNMAYAMAEQCKKFLHK